MPQDKKTGLFGQDKSKNFDNSSNQDFQQQNAPDSGSKLKDVSKISLIAKIKLQFKDLSLKKALLFCLVVLMVISFGAWGVFDFASTYIGSSGYVAKVGSVKITKDDFAKEYSLNVQKLSQRYGQSQQLDAIINSAEFKNIILQDMINKALIVEELKSNGVKLNRALMVKVIRQDESFFSGGVFDGAKFNQYLKASGQNEDSYIRQRQYELARDILLSPAISNNFGIQGIEFEGLAKILARAKQQSREFKLYEFKRSEQLNAKVSVGDADVANFYSKNQNLFLQPEVRSAQVLDLNEAIAKNIVVSDAEIQNFYNTKIKSNYQGGEKRSFYSALFNTKEQASEALAKIKSGQGYEEVVQKALKRGLDTMRFNDASQEDFDAAISKAVFNLKKGDVSGVVQNELGFYIIKVLDIKTSSAPSLASLKSKIVDSIKFDKACQKTTQLYSDAEDFSIQNPSFEELKKKLGFNFATKTINAKEAGSYIDKAILKANPKSNYPIFVSDEQNPNSCKYYIFKITSVKPSYFKALNDVKDEIRSALMQNAMQDAAYKNAELFASSGAKNSLNFAAKLSFKTITAIRAGQDMYPDGLIQAVFNLLNTGEKTPPIPTKDGFAVAELVAIKNPLATPNLSEQELKSLTEQMQKDFMMSSFEVLNQALAAKHGVKIYKGAL